MAFLGIGKKSPKPSSAPAPVASDMDELSDDGFDGSGAAVAAPAKPAKKSFFGAKAKAPAGKSGAAKSAAKPKAAKSRSSGGDMDIYTAVLVAAVLALAAGCVLVALDNLAGVEGTSDEGNPFVVLSSN